MVKKLMCDDIQILQLHAMSTNVYNMCFVDNKVLLLVSDLEPVFS